MTLLYRCLQRVVFAEHATSAAVAEYLSHILVAKVRDTRWSLEQPGCSVDSDAAQHRNMDLFRWFFSDSELPPHHRHFIVELLTASQLAAACGDFDFITAKRAKAAIAGL